MAVISINYSSLEDSIKKANKTASYLNEYISDMNSIAQECEGLDGSDPKGYVSVAAELARQKSRQAAKEKAAYSQFSKQLSELETLAKEKDQAVEKNIDVTVSDYVGKRTLGQKIGDFIYSRYVNFVNGVASLPGVGKYIAQGIRTAGNWISDQAVSCYNYFKYGDGKYIWNEIKSVAGVLVAAAGIVISALSVAAATPVLVGFAVAGVLFGAVYAVCKFGDMMATVEENEKARGLAKQYRNSTEDKDEWWDTSNDEGSITAARYYGSVSGVKDWINKTDFGDKTTNKIMGGVGVTYNVIEEIAKIGSTICNITVSVGNAQYVKTADGTWAKYASGKTIPKDGTFFQNIRTSYLEKVGYKFKRTKVFNKYAKTNGKMTIIDHDYSKAFKIKFFDGYGEKFAKAGIEVSGGTLAVLDASKIVKNLDGLASNIETLHKWDRDGTNSVDDAYDAFEAGFDIFSNFEFFDAAWGDGNKVIGVFKDIKDHIEDTFSPSENAFLAYMRASAQ